MSDETQLHFTRYNLAQGIRGKPEGLPMNVALVQQDPSFLQDLLQHGFYRIFRIGKWI